MRRADCPSSVGCCVTASAAYPPRALGWSTAALMRRTKAAAIRRPLSISAVSSVTTFSRLSRRARGGAHRASEGSWSSETSSTSWSSWKLQRWSALAPTHGRSKSPLGLTGLLLVSGDPGLLGSYDDLVPPFRIPDLGSRTQDPPDSGSRILDLGMTKPCMASPSFA